VNRRPLGALAALSGVRPCRLLRFSKNRHATKHFHRTNHPIIKSLEPGENWAWCYIDEIEVTLK
jgi:hypothetical protein